MSEVLKRLRDQHRTEVERGIVEAETELSALDARRDELLELIASARAWLGEEAPAVAAVTESDTADPVYTLHEAMEVILRQHPEGLKAPELAAEVERRGMYKRRDGDPPGPHQVHARVHNYPQLFRRETGRIYANRTLERVAQGLDELRDVARSEYERFGADPEGWSLDDYLKGIDRLGEAIDTASSLRTGTRERWEAEKTARNGFAQPLYYRGRRRLATGGLGFFPGKRGEKGRDWEPTDLSRAADRIAAAPLLEIYRQTAKQAGL